MRREPRGTCSTPCARLGPVSPGVSSDGNRFGYVDALAKTPTAVRDLGADTLKKIAVELTLSRESVMVNGG